MFLVTLALAVSGGLGDNRLLRISATSLYDAGIQQGEQARDRINAWFAGDEMRRIFDFATLNATGRAAFKDLRRLNAHEFPRLAEEISGIARGANVSEDHVWCANLIPELEGLMPPRPNVTSLSTPCGRAILLLSIIR